MYYREDIYNILEPSLAGCIFNISSGILGQDFFHRLANCTLPYSKGVDICPDQGGQCGQWTKKCGSKSLQIMQTIVNGGDDQGCISTFCVDTMCLC